MVAKAYFTNAMGLRAGAPVRFAGVDLGSIKSVRGKPEVKNSLVEVVMVFNPPYELKIPKRLNRFTRNRRHIGETFVTLTRRVPPVHRSEQTLF